MSPNAVIFIDANQYLDLYRTDGGNKLLPALGEQRDHIFITKQVVDEVHRNKVKATQDFLSKTLRKLEMSGMEIPDYLLSTTRSGIGEIGHQLRDIRKKINKAKEQFLKHTPDLLGQVSESKDEVSKALADIFSKAVTPNNGELQRAQQRRELGNPPGKPTDPLGDQLTWEQILSRCQDKPKLWIVSRDSDFATKYQRKLFLNAALYQELAQVYGAEPKVFCFDNLVDGLSNFAKANRLRAEKLPPLDVGEQIKKEQESLPPIGWLRNYDDADLIAIQRLRQKMHGTLMDAILSNRPELAPVPAIFEAEADEDGS